MDNFNKTIYFDKAPHISKVKSKKKQIVLLNTSSVLKDHLTGLQLRFDKKYDRIPTFTISRSGEIYQHFNPIHSSNVIGIPDIDKQAITIALENVGWLNYDPDKHIYTDWKDNVYKNPVMDMNWRGKRFWAIYSNEQLNALIDLIDYLCIGYSIEKTFIGSNIIIVKSKNFKGILNRSNFSKNHFDLSPAMNFEELTKRLNKEENVYKQPSE